ncbi:MAG: DUF1566 domain-containing protein [Bacteroidetes bacterium]|nr:DUF1566 domain-containing protein [Bacteroidota bacterium]
MKKLVEFLIVLGFILIVPSFCMFAQVGINSSNTAPDNSAMLDVQSLNKGILIPRMTSASRTAIAGPVAGLMVYQTDGLSGFYYYNGSVWVRIGDSGGSSSAHYIGELFGGGMVLWVDHTGMHGLIVSLTDISTTAVWSLAVSYTGATSTWDGQSNTTTIAGLSLAAQICADYVNPGSYGTGIYSDWYLPAIDQLSLIYHVKYILNKNMEGIPDVYGLANSYYWSSTEYNNYMAWYYYVDSGHATYYDKNLSGRVRAVRAF